MVYLGGGGGKYIKLGLFLGERIVYSIGFLIFSPSACLDYIGRIWLLEAKTSFKVQVTK